MTSHQPDSHLATYRKHAGLTQREVAFLLGYTHSAIASRYEKRHRLPPLETALAYEEILGVPLSKLFADIRERVGKEVMERRALLRSKGPAGNRTSQASNLPFSGEMS